MFHVYFIIILSVFFSLVVNLAMLRYAGRLGFIQSANERSSHVGNKPTGGGAGLLVASAIASLIVATQSDLTLLFPMALVIGLGLIGLVEDRGDLSIGFRFVAQSFFALSLLIYFEVAFDLSVPLSQFGPVWILFPILAIACVLWINLFNFMDGIDGMAISQALFVIGAMLFLATDLSIIDARGLWLWMVGIVAAGLVFVFFNWSPSKIFMGDAGAYFFAGVIFLGALWGVISGSLSPYASLILVGIFVTDGLVTLLARLINGQSWRHAHRTHAYQHLSRKYSHAKTTLLYMAINLLWLLPLAFSVQTLRLDPVSGAMIAYLPLIVFVIWGRAGQPEHAKT